ncbi:MAG: hypothetical protein DRG50_05615 [Deltaproteobacteria bacterium]|nr:MAG: hypothetical protein DRG50_05615 [Deltaproteobacteria bacterium]
MCALGCLRVGAGGCGGGVGLGGGGAGGGGGDKHGSASHLLFLRHRSVECPVYPSFKEVVFTHVEHKGRVDILPVGHCYLCAAVEREENSLLCPPVMGCLYHRVFGDRLGDRFNPRLSNHLWLSIL